MHIAQKLESNCINCNSVQFWINMQLPEVKMHRFASKTFGTLLEWMRKRNLLTLQLHHTRGPIRCCRKSCCCASVATGSHTMRFESICPVKHAWPTHYTVCLSSTTEGARGALHSGLAGKGILLDSVHQSDSEFHIFYLRSFWLYEVFVVHYNLDDVKWAICLKTDLSRIKRWFTQACHGKMMIISVILQMTSGHLLLVLWKISQQGQMKTLHHTNDV